MTTFESIITNLDLMDVMRMHVYRLSDLRDFLLNDSFHEYHVGNSGIMLTPLYINTLGIYELMPYDFVVKTTNETKRVDFESSRGHEGYWGLVRRITCKTVSREEPIVRKKDLLEWIGLLSTSTEIKDTIGRVFGIPFDFNDVYFEIY